MTRVVITPSYTPLIAMSVVCSIFVLVGLDGVLLLHADLAGGAFLVIGCFIWLYVATIRVELLPDVIVFKRFWRSEWKIDLKYAAVRHGLEPKALYLPGLLIFDRRCPRKLHGLGYAQFSKSDLERIRSHIEKLNNVTS